MAAILISQLTQSINGETVAGVGFRPGKLLNPEGKVIASYLNAIRNGNRDILPKLINLKFPPFSIDLPANFLDAAKTPHFLYGDKLRWLLLPFVFLRK